MVNADVSRFNAFSSPVVDKTFFVLPLDGQDLSAEFSHYAQIVSRHLNRYGMHKSLKAIDADYIVIMNYGVGSSRQISGEIPIYGQTGGGTTYHTGTVYTFGSGGHTTGNYSGYSYVPPTYGVTGYVPYSRIEYDRFLVIKIVDMRSSTTEKLRPAYEVTVNSTGGSATFSDVSACLFDAAFQEFPTSGNARVTLTHDNCGFGQ